MIRFSCPGCERVVEVSDADAGLSMMCPTCGKSLRVPGSPPAAPAPAAASGSSVTARPRLSARDAPDKGMEAIEDCPQCGKALQVPPGDVGRRVACPRCSHQFIARGTKLASRGEEAREERPRDEKARDKPRRDRRDDEDPDNRERDRSDRKKYCTRCGASMGRQEKSCPECDAPQPKERDPELADANSKKVAAGLCGILVLGGFGVHKFILGYTTAGVIMLLVTLLTCGVGYPIMHAIGIVEGIIYLTKSDEDFRRIYLVEKKEWF